LQTSQTVHEIRLRTPNRPHDSVRHPRLVWSQVRLKREELPQRDTMPTVSVRRATIEDMDTAADIIRSTAEWYRPIVDPKDMAEHAVDENWAARNYLQRECYLGRIGNEVVGFLTLQHAGDYIYVGYTYVPARFVGRGIGRRLLTHAAEVAKQRGYKGVVHIGHPEATWAVRAYKKMGYDIVLREREQVLAWNSGFLKPFYEEDFVLFRKTF